MIIRSNVTIALKKSAIQKINQEVNSEGFADVLKEICQSTDNLDENIETVIETVKDAFREDRFKWYVNKIDKDDPIGVTEYIGIPQWDKKFFDVDFISRFVGENHGEMNLIYDDYTAENYNYNTDKTDPGIPDHILRTCMITAVDIPEI